MSSFNIIVAVVLVLLVRFMTAPNRDEARDVQGGEPDEVSHHTHALEVPVKHVVDDRPAWVSRVNFTGDAGNVRHSRMTGDVYMPKS